MKNEKKERPLATSLQTKVLEAYFDIREPQPRPYIQMIPELKSTVQIRDDLAPTLPIPEDVIVGFMLDRGYVLSPDEDGIPMWHIYRMR